MSEQSAAKTEECNDPGTIPHGTICWAELASSNLDAATKFYTELLGWQVKGGDASPMKYTEIVVSGRPVGGMYQITEEMGGMPSHWATYVAVDDVDASAKRVEELGGKILRAPMDIPTVGRFCVITDPTGGTISLITLSGMHS